MLLQTQMPASYHQSLPQPSGTAQCQTSWHPAVRLKKRIQRKRHMKIKSIITALLMLVSLAGFAQTSKQTDEEKLAEYQNRERNALQLDYSMPDYSTSKIDAKVMGLRLAKILERILETYDQNVYLSTLSVIQSSQVEGLNYGRIKSMKLGKVAKHGNELTIHFNTSLEKNNLGLKKSQIEFVFIDGVSSDHRTNGRYIKE